MILTFEKHVLDWRLKAELEAVGIDASVSAQQPYHLNLQAQVIYDGPEVTVISAPDGSSSDLIAQVVEAHDPTPPTPPPPPTPITERLAPVFQVVASDPALQQTSKDALTQAVTMLEGGS